MKFVRKHGETVDLQTGYYSERFGRQEKKKLKRTAIELHYNLRNPTILDDIENAQTLGEATRIMMAARRKERDFYGIKKQNE